MRMSRILSVIVFCLFVGQAVQAQTTANPAQARGNIRGKVMNTSGVPIERQEVVIYRMDIPVMRLYTGGLGDFEALGIAPGTYEILIRADGYQEFRQRVDINNTAGLVSSASVTIFLDKMIEPVPVADYTGEDMTAVSAAELDRKYPKKALQEYERAIEEDRKGRTASAIQLLEDAVTIAPDFANGHDVLGKMYQKANRYEDAEREYMKARELSPNLVAPMLNLGGLYIQQAEASKGSSRRVIGRILDQALDILEAATRLKPGSAQGFYLLGTANFKSAFYEEAETDFRRALENDHQMGLSRLMLANIYIRERKWQEVLDELDAYLMDHPKASNRAEVEATRQQVTKKLHSTP